MQHWENTSFAVLSEIVNGLLDIERWDKIKDYEGLYEISTFGRVKSLRKSKLLKLRLDKDKYVIAALTDYTGVTKHRKVHRLMWNTFKGGYSSTKYETNHKNGIKWDNRLWNLESCDESYNQIHARKTGLNKQIGENHTDAKLTSQQVLEIFYSPLPYPELRKLYNYRNISSIKTGRQWSSVTGKKYEKKKLDTESVIDIYKSPKSTQDLCDAYNIKPETVRRIKRRERYAQSTSLI